MEKAKVISKVKVFCDKHPQKKLEYVCTNPSCQVKLFCGSCLFKKEHCRHDDHLKDLDEFLEEQRKQFEKKGLLSDPEIFDAYTNKSNSLNHYQSVINQQIKEIEAEFSSTLSSLTTALGEAKKSLIMNLNSYVDAYAKSFQLLENKINANFTSTFFVSKYKTFEDMLNSFSPFTQDSLKNMVSPIIDNYTKQFDVPKDIKDYYSDIKLMGEDNPIFDSKGFTKLKNHLKVFVDRMNTSAATLINVKSHMTETETLSDVETSPSIRQREQRAYSRKSQDRANSLDRTLLRKGSNSSSTVILPTINSSITRIDSGILKESKLLKSTGKRDSPSPSPSKLLRTIAGINTTKGPVNVSKLHHSASFDTGHTRTVFCVQYLGKRLVATASDDGIIKIWDVITFRNVAELRGHAGGVRALTLLPDGKLVSCSWDKTLKLWNTPAIIAQADLDRDSDTSLSTHSIHKTSNDEDVSIKTMVGHTFAVLCVVASADGKTLFSGSNDCSIKLWDVNSGSCFRTFSGHQSEVLSIAVTRNGTILSGSGDRSIKIWHMDKKSNSNVKTLSGHTSSVWTILVLPGDTTAVSGSLDKTIRVWDIESGECLKTLKDQLAQIMVLKNYQEDMMISCDSDGAIKIWSVSKGFSVLTSLKKTDVKSSIYGVDFTEDFMILSSGTDKRLSVWN